MLTKVFDNMDHTTLKRKYSVTCSSEFQYGCPSSSSSVASLCGSSTSSTSSHCGSNDAFATMNNQFDSHDNGSANLRRKRFKPSVTSDNRYRKTSAASVAAASEDFDAISGFFASDRKNSYMSDSTDGTSSISGNNDNNNLSQLLHGADHLCGIPHVPTTRQYGDLFEIPVTTTTATATSTAAAATATTVTVNGKASPAFDQEKVKNNQSMTSEASTCHSRQTASHVFGDSTFDMSHSAWRSNMTSSSTLNTTSIAGGVCDDNLHFSNLASPRFEDAGVMNRSAHAARNVNRSVSPRGNCNKGHRDDHHDSSKKINDIFMDDLEDVVSKKRTNLTPKNANPHMKNSHSSQTSRAKTGASAHSHLTSRSDRSRDPKVNDEDEDESQSISDTHSVGGDSTFFNIDLTDFENGSNDSFGFSSAGERSALGSDLNVNLEDLLNSSGFDSYPDTMSQSDNEEDFTAREDYIEEAREMARKYGGSCLASNCFDRKENLAYKCCFGHEWMSDSVLTGGKWCPKCNVEFEKARQYALEHDGSLISAFRAKSIAFQCRLGHQWTVRANRYQAQKRWCAQCSRMERKIQKDKQRQRDSEARRNQAVHQQELFREARTKYMNDMHNFTKNASSNFASASSPSPSSSTSQANFTNFNTAANASHIPNTNESFNFGNTSSGNSSNNGYNNSNSNTTTTSNSDSHPRIRVGGRAPMNESMIRKMIEEHIQRRSHQQASEFIQRRDVDSCISFQQAFVVYKLLNMTVEYITSNLNSLPKGQATKFYRSTALLVHPDKNGHPKASEAFQKLQSTWAKCFPRA